MPYPVPIPTVLSAQILSPALHVNKNTPSAAKIYAKEYLSAPQWRLPKPVEQIGLSSALNKLKTALYAKKANQLLLVQDAKINTLSTS